MIYKFITTKIIPVRYRAKGKDWFINREVPFYVGMINPFSDYIIMETQKPTEAIYHTERELAQVEAIFQKENIKYTKYKHDEKVPTRIMEQKNNMDRINNYFSHNYFGRQPIKCDICEDSGWIDTDTTCPKCEP